MQRVQRPKFFGYVKVELVSRSPRLWSWRVESDLADGVPAARSSRAYRCAEDAWHDGRKELIALEGGGLSRASRAMHKANETGNICACAASA
jgi:hypothetical protein